jgi:hypothetical protein
MADAPTVPSLPSGSGGTAAGTDAPDPPARTGLLRRPWVRVIGLGLGVGALAAVALPLAVVGPYVRDDLRLDRIVRAVALDWRDFGEARARERLEYELDHQGIGPWVEDDDCALREEVGDLTVGCAWGVALPVPFTELVVPVRFSSDARIEPGGDLR